MAKQSKGFQFKQFFIAHDQCAMKVNTDSILLGAVADTSNANRLLDLGSGSGLIAIMLAQRTASNVEIIGIELEPQAFEQAQSNVQNSPWQSKIHLIQADILQLNFADRFDLIVSNPPYFEHSLASPNAQRQLARNATQSHLAWLEQGKKWLTPQGKISFILPFDTANQLIAQTADTELHCIEHWTIYTKLTKPPKRAIVTFSLENQAISEKQIVIYQQDNRYTPEFKALTQDFYLNL